MVGRSMGIDVAWGDTSRFAIVIAQYRNNKVEVFYAESFEKPLMNEIINHIMRLKQRHHITKIYVDGANPEVIRELKARIDEDTEYEDQIQRWKSYNDANIVTLKWLSDNMFVVPIHFNKEHRNMLAHAKKLMEYGNVVVAINPSHTELITALRTAVEKEH